jgi:hypothetical protein
MTWSLCEHHPGGARMTCGRSPHHGDEATMTSSKQRFAFELAFDRRLTAFGGIVRQIFDFALGKIKTGMTCGQRPYHSGETKAFKFCSD